MLSGMAEALGELNPEQKCNLTWGRPVKDSETNWSL